MASSEEYKRIVISTESQYGLPPGSIEALEVPPGFEDAVGGEVPDTQSKGGFIEGAKKVWEGSLGGYAQRAYEGLVGNGEGGAWSISKMLSTGTFIVLGVVIIALAVLSNKTVQNVAVKAVTKGA